MDGTSQDTWLMQQVWRCSIPSWVLLFLWLLYELHELATHHDLSMVGMFGELALAILGFVSLIAALVAAVHTYRLVVSRTANNELKRRAVLTALPGLLLLAIWFVGRFR